jgi:ketosteroid isomerase-like protein
MQRHWLRISIALAAATLLVQVVAASEQTDVMATVHQFVNGFNKGDTKTELTACADQASIIDEFPPYVWQGTAACSRWANDYEADAKKNGTTEAAVALDNPRHVEVTGDRAYVVVPATFTFKQKGKPMKETGSTLTVALQKTSAGWRITAWAWASQ